MTTTTDHLRKIPEYFSSLEEAKRYSKNKIQTNFRYNGFNQTHFTIGDESQFEQYRDNTNNQICISEIDLEKNIFNNIDIPCKIWDGYYNLQATSVINTFRYIFNKFKKGIFIKIQNNELKVFLPFSKYGYINEWSDHINYDPSKYKDMDDFLKFIAESEGRKYNSKYVNKFTEYWYANNFLVRYEYPLTENDSGVSQMSDMFRTLCKTRTVPDIELFINRRDFPLLKKDLTEPYIDMFDGDIQLLSYKFNQYSPILGGAVTNDYADIPIPTWEDWSRISCQEGKYFIKSSSEYIIFDETPWKDKKPTAVFRGSSTGRGIDINTNPRLKVSYMSKYENPIINDIPLLDAGITSWNLRPRKLKNNMYLQTIDIKNIGFSLVSPLSPNEQARYKYIINIDGHVTAFRISLELGMRSVILLVESSYYIWFMKLLKPYIHYIPIKEDLSDLISQIKWCRTHDKECEQIANNARIFYEKYLCKDALLDYLQKVIIKLKIITGIYLYNFISPFEYQILEEKKTISESMLVYPHIGKFSKDISSIPKHHPRTFGLLQGVQWIYNMLCKEEDPELYLNISNPIFKSSNSEIFEGILGQLPVVIKRSLTDKYNECIHETFIGLNCINNILRYIPNFVYTIGLYEKKSHINVVLEKIDGITLYQYLKDPQFNMKDFLIILLQLCLSLQIAQNMYNFVHWDLLPWNIIIYKFPSERNIDYMLNNNDIIRIKTNIIPIIIDYGKSHIIYNDIHYGFINNYKSSSIQDILSILFSSIYEIIVSRELTKKDIFELLILINFISNTDYYPNKFNNIKKLQSFLKIHKKFSSLISTDKKDLENKTPIDMFKYIMYSFSYKFPIINLNTSSCILNRENPEFIFDYILSLTIDEKLDTYINIFKKLKTKTSLMLDKKEIDFYILKDIHQQIQHIYKYMNIFIESNNLIVSMVMFEDIIKYITKLYNNEYLKMIDKMAIQKYNKNSRTNIDENIKEFSYSEETFLLPDIVYNLLNISNSISMEDIIQKDTLYKRNIIANIKTLRRVAIHVFTNNLNQIQSNLEEEQYINEDIERYINNYRKIIFILL